MYDGASVSSSKAQAEEGLHEGTKHTGIVRDV